MRSRQLVPSATSPRLQLLACDVISSFSYSANRQRKSTPRTGVYLFPRAGRSPSPRRLPGSSPPNGASSGRTVSSEDRDSESAGEFDAQRRGRMPVLPSRARGQSDAHLPYTDILSSEPGMGARGSRANVGGIGTLGKLALALKISVRLQMWPLRAVCVSRHIQGRRAVVDHPSVRIAGLPWAQKLRVRQTQTILDSRRIAGDTEHGKTRLGELCHTMRGALCVSSYTYVRTGAFETRLFACLLRGAHRTAGGAHAIVRA